MQGDGGQMDEIKQIETRERLTELRIEHRDLDAAISLLAHGPHVDQLQLRRLKKRKLLLKDTIARLESSLIPNLDA